MSLQQGQPNSNGNSDRGVNWGVWSNAPTGGCTFSQWIMMWDSAQLEEGSTWFEIFDTNTASVIWNAFIFDALFSFQDNQNGGPHGDPTARTVGVWYHFAIVHNAATGHLTFYTNGVQVSDFAGSAGTFTYVTPQLDSGVDHTQANGAAAMTMSDVRVYNRVLSAQEIQELYNARGADHIMNGLIFKAMFNERASGTLTSATPMCKDASVSRLSGTPNFFTDTNTPVYSTDGIKRKRRHL